MALLLQQVASEVIVRNYQTRPKLPQKLRKPSEVTKPKLRMHYEIADYITL